MNYLILCTGNPCRRPMAAAKFTEVVVFPTPPFWLATAMIFPMGLHSSFLILPVFLITAPL